MNTIKTRIEVINELAEEFEIEDNKIKGSYQKDEVFGISKRHMSRFEVIETLQNYFKEKYIENGYLSVSPITFVHTTFEVLEGEPNK